MVCVGALVVGASITLSTGFMSKFDYHKAMAEGHGYNLYVADLLQHFGIPRVDVPDFTIATTHDEIRDKTLNEKVIVTGKDRKSTRLNSSHRL